MNAYEKSLADFGKEFIRKCRRLKRKKDELKVALTDTDGIGMTGFKGCVVKMTLTIPFSCEAKRRQRIEAIFNAAQQSFPIPSNEPEVRFSRRRRYDGERNFSFRLRFIVATMPSTLLDEFSLKDRGRVAHETKTTYTII